MGTDGKLHRGGGRGAQGSSQSAATAGPSEADRVVLGLAREMHRAQTASGPAEITLHEAILRKQAQVAMKGSPLALRDILDRIDRATAADAARIADDCGFWSAYRDQQRKALDRALAARQATDDILPHPDDIEIDAARGVRFLGPFDAAERKAMSTTIAMRDALYLQHALEFALDGRRDNVPAPGQPLVFAMLTNARMPPSLRLSELAQLRHLMHLECQPLRWLLRETHRAWHRAGVPVPRGRRFQPAEIMAELFDLLVTGVRDMVAARTKEEEHEIAVEVAVQLQQLRTAAQSSMT